MPTAEPARTEAPKAEAPAAEPPKAEPPKKETPKLPVDLDAAGKAEMAKDPLGTIPEDSK